MRNRLTIVADCALATVSVTGAAAAQTATPDGPVSIVVANPTYISIPMEIAVDRPAADVWKRVGKFCDIGEWLECERNLVGN